MRRYVVVVVAVLVLAGIACGSRQPDKGDRYGAIVICEKFVKDRLVSPSTAKFGNKPGCSQVDASADQWRVTGYVDSQNRLGATVRSDYDCTVTYKGNDRWGLDDIDIVTR